MTSELPATADNKVLKGITKCFVVIKFLNRQTISSLENRLNEGFTEEV